VKNRERGRVAITIRAENIARKKAQQPGPSASPAKYQFKKMDKLFQYNMNVIQVKIRTDFILGNNKIM